MANKFWVGGGASTNWNATGNTNWSATSGGANNDAVPGSTDDVFFDANSGAGTSVISASISIQSLDCTGFTGTLTHNASVTLTIAGNGAVFKLVAGMTYNVSSNTNRTVAFTGTSGTALLTSGGKQMGTLQVNGAGGTVQAQDVFSDLRQLTITAGTFDANNLSTHQIGAITATGSTARVLTMGTSTINLFNTSGTVIDLSGTNITATLTSGTFRLTPLTPTTNSRTFLLANGPFGTVEIPDTNGIIAFQTPTGNIGTLKCSGYSQITFTAGQSFTIGAFVSTTTGSAGPIISSATNGTSATLTGSGSITITSAALKDIAFTTATWTALNCVKWGAVTGITFTNSGSGARGIIGG